MLEDFSTWGFGSSIPSTARSQRDLRWICLRTKVASDLPVSPCHPEGLWLPFWVTELAGLIRSSPEERTDPSTQTLDLWSGRNSRGHVGPFYAAHSINDSLTHLVVVKWGVVLTFKKKNTLTFKSPSSSLFSLCSFLNIAEFTTYIWFCALFFFHLSTS